MWGAAVHPTFGTLKIYPKGIRGNGGFGAGDGKGESLYLGISPAGSPPDRP
jgi:hypothetical protein